MDWNAILVGFGVGVAITLVLGVAFVWATSRKEIAELRDRLSRAESAKTTIPIGSGTSQPVVEPETRAVLMAELGEATVAMTQLRRRTADYDALKEEVETLRPKAEAAEHALAELEVAQAHIQRMREDLARASTEAATLGSENAKAKAELALQRDRLAAVERTTASLLSQLKAGPEVEAAEPVAEDSQEHLPIDPATVAAVTFAPLEPALKPDTGDDADPLGQIPGVGPVFERRLWEAGIRTYADLAAASPDHVLAIIRPEHWQQIEPELWIAEAKARTAN